MAPRTISLLRASEIVFASIAINERLFMAPRTILPLQANKIVYASIITYFILNITNPIYS